MQYYAVGNRIPFCQLAGYGLYRPGSGSLIIQMLIAASVGAAFYFRQVRDKIKSILFGGGKAEAEPGSSDDGNSRMRVKGKDGGARADQHLTINYQQP